MRLDDVTLNSYGFVTETEKSMSSFDIKEINSGDQNAPIEYTPNKKQIKSKINSKVIKLDLNSSNNAIKCPDWVPDISQLEH